MVILCVQLLRNAPYNLLYDKQRKKVKTFLRKVFGFCAFFYEILAMLHIDAPKKAQVCYTKRGGFQLPILLYAYTRGYTHLTCTLKYSIIL